MWSIFSVTVYLLRNKDYFFLTTKKPSTIVGNKNAITIELIVDKNMALNT